MPGAHLFQNILRKVIQCLGVTGGDKIFINVHEVIVGLGGEVLDVLLSQNDRSAKRRLLQTVGQTRDP